MIPEDSESDDWLARRAAWREDWVTVRAYVGSEPLGDRILRLIAADPDRGGYRRSRLWGCLPL